MAVDNAGAIVGIIFGSLLFITLVIATIVVVLKTCMKPKGQTSTDIEMLNQPNIISDSEKGTKFSKSKVVPFDLVQNNTMEEGATLENRL